MGRTRQYNNPTAPVIGGGGGGGNTYVPTLTITANVNALSRIGNYFLYEVQNNIVKVSGGMSITCASGATNSEVAISLPVASNLSASDAWGVGVAANSTEGSAAIIADATNDRLLFRFHPIAALQVRAWSFVAHYKVV